MASVASIKLFTIMNMLMTSAFILSSFHFIGVQGHGFLRTLKKRPVVDMKCVSGCPDLIVNRHKCPLSCNSDEEMITDGHCAKCVAIFGEVTSSTTCPIEAPQSGDSCKNGLVVSTLCEYGQECCLDSNSQCQCSASYTCTCDAEGRIFVCSYTDACYLPGAEPCTAPTALLSTVSTSTAPSTEHHTSNNACPTEQPEPGDSCSGGPSTCEYGQECCLDRDTNECKCTPSYVCNCGEEEGMFACFFTDSCFSPDSVSCIPS